MPISESKCEFQENPGFKCSHGPQEGKFCRENKNLIFYTLSCSSRYSRCHHLRFMVRNKFELSQVNYVPMGTICL